MTGIHIKQDYLSYDQIRAIADHINALGDSTIYRYGSTAAYNGGEYLGDIPQLIKDTFKDIDFNSLTIRTYYPGKGIGYHIDNDKAGEVITIYSMLAEATMNLRLPKAKTAEMQIVLYPNSLLTLSGEARWQYEHQILPVKEKRVSLVFRNC